jgi:pimeloyl-ACP methyl ester carboxylesterase
VFLLQHDGSSTISDEQMPTIHLVGHSRGGGIALVAGRELLHEGLLGKVILWNSVGRWERWTERQRAAWFAAGFIEIENTRTGQMLKIFTDIVRDVEDHAERLSLLHAVKALRGRVHAVHSQADLTTPLEEVEALLKEAGASDVLTVLPGSTHTFGMTHPLQRITGTFVHVLDHTTTLLQQ